MQKARKSLERAILETTSRRRLLPKKKTKTCESVFPSTLVRLVSRSVMPAGSFTASSTVSSPTDRCPPTRPSVVVMTPSTPSSPKPALASTSPELSSSISSPPSSMRSEPAPTDSSSTPSS
ncbi:unnamed protein product [Oikopleura dioica]|uniref:Uncharacterized protein n=1 Tax=Oikopleura dioica TaxID=34765 RepID=E4YC17_OIKDI|nr:unnamed protein product [Oikopleura dioica]